MTFQPNKSSWLSIYKACLIGLMTLLPYLAKAQSEHPAKCDLLIGSKTGTGIPVRALQCDGRLVQLVEITRMESVLNGSTLIQPGNAVDQYEAGVRMLKAAQILQPDGQLSSNYQLLTTLNHPVAVDAISKSYSFYYSMTYSLIEATK